MTLCVRDGGCRLSAGWLMEESRKLAREGRGTRVKHSFVPHGPVLNVCSIVWDMPMLEEFEAQYKTLRGW